MKARRFNPSITLAEYAHQIIQQNVEKIIAQEAAVLKDKDPEPLHQMRVSMRRLRTAVKVFSTTIIIPKSANDAAIGKIAKSLGGTRDLDVLQQELITHYQPLLKKAEQPKFEAVLKHVSQTRRQSFSQLQKTLNGDRYQKVKQSLQAWLDNPTYTPMGSLAVLQILPDLLLPLVCQLFLHPGWLVGTTIQSGEVALVSIADSQELNHQFHQFNQLLHGLRKQIKGVRYQAEFFAGFYDQTYLERVDEFKAIQDLLGQLQDHVVLRQFLESTLKADVAKVLPSVDRVLQQDQTNFWQNWQPLQQRYLSLEFRQSLRSLLTTPTALTLPDSGNSNKQPKASKQTNAKSVTSKQ
ncbi:CHAD domain-containing protein [Pantanalinema rosaneae CENA516]|uniref:CHAD domain-containing protein n=1 Tax=Pantanalinema rosaneae TaxID=1620701 RepID=UPI003D6F0452